MSLWTTIKDKFPKLFYSNDYLYQMDKDNESSIIRKKIAFAISTVSPIEVERGRYGSHTLYGSLLQLSLDNTSPNTSGREHFILMGIETLIWLFPKTKESFFDGDNVSNRPTRINQAIGSHIIYVDAFFPIDTLLMGDFVNHHMKVKSPCFTKHSVIYPDSLKLIKLTQEER